MKNNSFSTLVTRFNKEIILYGIVFLGMASYCAANVLASNVNNEKSFADKQLIIQVNQVVLDSEGPKKAIIEYRGKGKKGVFHVTRDGQQILTGVPKITQPFNAWGDGIQYYEIDFSELAIPGQYRIDAQFDDAPAATVSINIQKNALFNTTAKALLDYFKNSRNTQASDHNIRIFDKSRFADVWGGWNDAGGDSGKYLSHLSYANFFNPQQASFATWVLAKTADSAAALYEANGLHSQVLDEAFWGADYLHRILDEEGYFYTTVFDKWGTDNAERLITGFEGIEGKYTESYKSSFRAGGGMAIAALARASIISKNYSSHGQFSGEEYQRDAERAFEHLEHHNTEYCNDGVENIIDDYTSLMAAVELFHATEKQHYLDVARERAHKLNARLTKEGWFKSDAGDRPYYHGVEAGLPLVSLYYYTEIENNPSLREDAKNTVSRALKHQIELNHKVVNPYNYARQEFKLYRSGKLEGGIQEGFFMPHENETGYWWQGESARLSSLSSAAILAGRWLGGDRSKEFGTTKELAEFAQNQVDWTLGRNPYAMCMLYGFGLNNPPSAESAGTMLNGGISNGITGNENDPSGYGISFASGPDENQWRWVEQWIPHSAWLLFNATLMVNVEDNK